MQSITDKEQALIDGLEHIDGRYTITKEHTGHPNIMYVVRFCGNYICSRYVFISAIEWMIYHNKKRIGIL